MENGAGGTPVPAYAETELRSRLRAGVTLGSGAGVLPLSPELTRKALPRTRPTHSTRLVDAPERIVKQPRDLVDALIHLAIVAGVLVLAVFGQQTAAGVTEDVVDVVNATARQFLLLPVAVAEGLVVFTIPVIVLAMQIIRRQWRELIEAVIAAVLASGLAILASGIVSDLGSTYAIKVGLTRATTGGEVAAFSAYLAGISALLTVSGRSSSRLIRWSWLAVSLVAVLAVIQGNQTLAGAIIAVLAARAIGLFTRYIGGVRSTRASGPTLITGLRRAGLSPDLVVRLDADPGDTLTATLVTAVQTVGHNAPPAPVTESAREPLSPEHQDLARIASEPDPLSPSPDTEVPDPLPLGEEVEALLAEPTHPQGPWRRYAVISPEGRRDAQVLDADRQVLGVLASAWEQVRLRGIERPRSSTVQEAAEHSSLMTLATREAGVRVPALHGVAESGDSIVLIRENVGAAPLAAVPAAALTDDVLDDVWGQVRIAHNAGIAHRALDAQNIRLDGEGRVWLDRWDSGSIAAPEIARRIDGVQVLVTLALLVGEDRAVASAGRNLSTRYLAELSPLLQQVILTAETRASLRKTRKLLPALRERLSSLIPAAAAEPAPIQRFTLKQALSAAVLVVALTVLFGTFTWSDIVGSFQDANPWWLAGAFGAALSTYLGAAIGLKAFTPERLGLWRTTLVQVAASIVALVAPAGVGPAAVDLRYLTREKVPVTLAAATVTLTQVSRVLTTVVLLVVITVASGTTGRSGGVTQMSAGPVLVGILVALALVGILVAIPRIRNWAGARVRPVLQQIGPRILWVVSSPVRLLTGLAGNALQTVGYVAAFGMTLAAFGETLPISTLAITYLVSQSAGSAVPSPAGIGPVEVALTSGLAIAGIPSGIALSATIVFRVLTLLARIPLGWLALKYLQGRNVL